MDEITNLNRRASAPRIRKSLSVGIICLYSSSLSASAFTSLNERRSYRIHFPSYADISVRKFARRDSGRGTSTVSFANDTSPSSPNAGRYSRRNENSANVNVPTRIVGNQVSDAATLKAAAEASTRRNVESNRNEAGAWYQRDEMLQHDILTKEAEYKLGNSILHAKKLRDEMTEIIDTMRLEKDENNLAELLWEEDEDAVWSRGLAQMYEEEGMEYMSMSIYDTTSDDNISNGFDSSDSWESTNFAGDQRISSTLVQDGSKLSRSGVEADLLLLSDDDIKIKMNIKGGKEELREILYLGSEARTSLMRSNIRLVVSISKKWMGSSYAAGSAGGSRAINLYSGGWDRPSLDEVIQEGILGLARAVDKFDPSRGLRFSTYSTHWITSYVRQCFQNASTGCLKVPSQLHEIKNAYKSRVKEYVDSSVPIPSEEEIAAEIGVTLNRLLTALRATEALLSIDEPIYNSGNAAYKGSGAGGDNTGDSNLLMSDRLECSEIPPEEFVEISFLRQTLENAMAAELSPHERDILRLRLGLDDGQTRTVRQVVEECGGGITVSDVRSAERRAFKKLRSPNAVHAHNLVQFLEMIGADIDTTLW